MSRVQLSLRITRAQNAALQQFADQAGLSGRYQAAVRAIEAGLGVLLSGPSSSMNAEAAEIVSGMGELLARVERLDAVVDRALYTGSAAYVFARHAALVTATDPAGLNEKLAEATRDAYARQRDLARGGQ